MDRYVTTCCPSCGKFGRARTEHMGRSVVCKKCGGQFRVSKYVHIDCPECRRDVRVPPSLLGLAVVCKHCDATFQAKPAGDRPLALPSARPPRSLGRVSVVGEVDPAQRQLQTRLEASLADREALLGERENLSLERDSLLTRLAEFEKRAQTLADSREELQRELAQTREERDRFSHVIDAFEIDRVSLQSALASRQHALEEISARLAETEKRHSQARAELETHVGQAAEHRSCADELEQLLAREGEALCARLSESEEKHSRLREELESLTRQADEHRSCADELEISLAKASEDRDVKTPEIEALRTRLSEVEERHSQALAELATHAGQAAEHRSRRRT